ncbi:hypothetical protein FOA52_012323 [Chlamydomonas sp. UWO 241]|nr:hypothetical protein FOA52_012323 [Chlamydomonas sp. UWO 241]
MHVQVPAMTTTGRAGGGLWARHPGRSVCAAVCRRRLPSGLGQRDLASSCPWPGAACAIYGGERAARARGDRLEASRRVDAVARQRVRAGAGSRRLPNGLEVSVVSESDVDFLYQEVYVGGAYLREGVGVRSGDTVLDVGANIGFFSMAAAEAAGPSGRVIAVEPLPETFAALSANARAHAEWAAGRAAPIQPLKLGVSDRAGEAVFTFYTRAAGWSTMAEDSGSVHADMRAFLATSLESGGGGLPAGLLIDVGRWAALRVPALYEALAWVAVEAMLVVGRRRVTCRLDTVSGIMASAGLVTIDLLKVDVERAELAVLRGVAPTDWQRIRQVVVEVHDTGGALDAVRSLLASAGFDAVSAQQDTPLAGTALWNVYAKRSTRRS